MYIKNITKGVNKMKLVVGLGNPGKEYANTRHNIGFMYLDYICKEDNFVLNKKFNALEFEQIIDNEKILFIKPLSFMNLSGEVVINYLNYYKLNNSDILVIQDDLDMEVGKYKLLFNRGDGGHNGIKNIISNIHGKDFLRLKIGISKVDNIDTRNYVLGKFSKVELSKINDAFEKLNCFIDDFVKLDRDRLTNKYNSKVKEVNNEIL